MNPDVIVLGDPGRLHGLLDGAVAVGSAASTRFNSDTETWTVMAADGELTARVLIDATASADGVVIGSVVVQRMLDGGGPEGVAALVREFRDALDAAYSS